MCTELKLQNVAFFDVRRLLQSYEIQKGVEDKLKRQSGGSDSSWGEWMAIVLKKIVPRAIGSKTTPYIYGVAHGLSSSSASHI